MAFPWLWPIGGGFRGSILGALFVRLVSLVIPRFASGAIVWPTVNVFFNRMTGRQSGSAFASQLIHNASPKNRIKAIATIPDIIDLVLSIDATS
jgi:hypothetical protein